MKFQVSVLNEKGTKKIIESFHADRFGETPMEGEYTWIHFYSTVDRGYWSKPITRVVVSVLLAGSYIVEEVSDAAYS